MGNLLEGKKEDHDIKEPQISKINIGVHSEVKNNQEKNELMISSEIKKSKIMRKTQKKRKKIFLKRKKNKNKNKNKKKIKVIIIKKKKKNRINL